MDFRWSFVIGTRLFIIPEMNGKPMHHYPSEQVIEETGQADGRGGRTSGMAIYDWFVMQ